LGPALLSAQSNFSSIHVFGDGVCTTTDQDSTLTSYYGDRYCNGRVWVEVLTQWQGLSYVEANNDSFFGQNTTDLLVSLAGYTPPIDVATALYVVWANDGDFVGFFQDAESSFPLDASNDTAWDTFVSATVDGHEDVIETLHGLGVRVLVLPKAVDIAAAPFYASLSVAERSYVRGKIAQFNTAFEGMIETFVPTLPGLEVYVPDSFALFEELLSNPAKFGVVNPGIDAISDIFFMTGSYPDIMGIADNGANYVFWDDLHPTAKVQMHLADLVQQMISPATISGISPVGGGYELEMSNVPVGRDGSVRGSGNLVDWMEDLSFSSISVVQDVTVPSTDPSRFFRLQFPVVWTWP